MNANAPRLRLGILGIVVLSLFAALLARLWYLQVLAAPTLKLEAQRNRVRLVTAEAPRGRILDRQGRVLVDNRITSAVVVNRDTADRNPELLPRLSVLLGIEEPELRRRLDDDRFTRYKPVPVAEDVPKELLIHIREHRDEFPGVDGVQLTQRAYPHGPLAAHVLGYVGQINDRELEARRAEGYKGGEAIGKSGVELTYEAELRGQPAIEKLEVDSRDRVLRSLGSQPAKPGNDVQLSIDLDAQLLAEESLAQGLDRARRSTFAAPAGAVVVLDPRDGAVLALASNPTYDPTEFVNGIGEGRFAELQQPEGHFPLNNRAIQGLYPPASTFKLATAMAALEHQLIDPTTTIDDNGSIQIGNPPQTFRNAFGTAFGAVDLRRAFTVSSDVFFYRIGERFWNGRNRYGLAIQEAAKALGMGRRTEIDIPYEVAGRVPDPETRRRLHESNPEAFPTKDWFTGDNVNLAIGQGEMAVTPLQLANAYAALANGGTLFVPHVGLASHDISQKTVRQLQHPPPQKVEISPTDRQAIIEGLAQVTSDPTGTAAAAFAGFPLDRFPVAGKTGTAQVVGKEDTALFAAFGPVESPRYTVAVVMEESGLGGSAAAPVARRVLEGLIGDPPQPVTRGSGLD